MHQGIEPGGQGRQRFLTDMGKSCWMAWALLPCALGIAAAPADSVPAAAVPHSVPSRLDARPADPQGAGKAQNSGLLVTPGLAASTSEASEPTLSSRPKDIRAQPPMQLSGGLFGIDAVPMRVNKNDVVRESEYRAPQQGGEYVRRVSGETSARTYTDARVDPAFTIDVNWTAAKATVSWMREQRVAIIVASLILLALTWRWYGKADQRKVARTAQSPAGSRPPNGHRHRRRRRHLRQHSATSSGSPSSRTVGALPTGAGAGRSSGRHR